MATECNICKKTPHAYETYNTAFIKVQGVCPECLKDSKGLIKVDDHYIPWRYRNYVDFDMETNEVTISAADQRYFDDVYAKLPKVEWCEKYKKYKLTFDSPDLGGYDVTQFEWYYDNKEDIVRAIFGELIKIMRRPTVRDPKHSEYLS